MEELIKLANNLADVRDQINDLKEQMDTLKILKESK